MITTPNLQLNWKSSLAPDPEVPLEALPIAAALADSEGSIIAVNSLWTAAHPTAGLGVSGNRWASQIHSTSPELRAALLAGLESVLKRREARFVQDYVLSGVGAEASSAAGHSRITLSACPPGALLLHQELSSDGRATSGERTWQSQKMETIGRLVGGVAHDFANLLTLIAGYGDILLSRVGEKDPLRPELDEIRKAAGRGARLTSQLLAFTRGQTTQPRPLDLNLLANDIQRMLRPIIGEYIDLQLDLRPNLGKVVADPGQMEQVMMNLILNARDAMPTGGRIRIETREEDLRGGSALAHAVEPGPYVMLAISDTGHGIGPAAMEHLFEPFFTTKEKGKGTGLGLSTVYSIVKQSGGGIRVDSEPGKGATFTMCLPRAEDCSEKTEPSSAARPAPAGSETVLLVEDEDTVRRLLMHVLLRRGYHVVEAANAEEALDIYEKSGSSIHLVLTDMVMPRMSGRELADHVRRIRPEAKVIFMSGYTDDVLVRTGALSPGMSFLQKPLRPEVLAAKVREALDSPPLPFNPR